MCTDEVGNKKVYLSEDVLHGSDGEENTSVLVDEVRVKLREHYEELRECVCAVAGMVDALEAKVERVDDPCERERRALGQCYACHAREGLRCEKAVARFAACVRKNTEKHL